MAIAKGSRASSDGFRKAYARAVIDRARHLIRAVKLLALDGRIPKPLRGLAAFGLLPIPGPLDEAVLLVVGLVLVVFYRGPLREAWAKADKTLGAGHTARL
jgi:hypothetical protein